MGTMEDRVTGAIERRTSRLPSIAFLTAAIGSMAASAILKAVGKEHWSLFVGQWAPTLLILGTYNKIVKERSQWGREQRVA